MEALKKLIFDYYLSNYKDYPLDEFRPLGISTVIFLEAMIVGISFMPIQYSAGGFSLFIYTVLVLISGVISLCIIKCTSKTYLARIFFIITSNTYIYFNAYAVGLDGGIHYFLGPTASLPFLMFNPKKDKIYIAFSFLLTITVGVLLHLTDLQLINRVILSEKILASYSVLSGILALTMSAFSTYYFQLIVLQKEIEIENKNQHLFNSEKLASLGTLSAGIAHEINTPLTVIQGTTQQLKREIGDTEKLDKILKMVERISQIVKSLKAYNRNESNLPLNEINLKEIIEECFILHKSDLNGFHIKFETKCPEMIKVFSRESDLIQVFINLISNSIHAIKNQSENKWIHINATEIENLVVIEFSDSGSGISPTHQTKIFDPFYTSKKVGEGTGLGLYITRSLLDTMNGKIEYLPNTNHTTFKISLQKYII
jgi:signal transduction histidine kinase